MIRVIKDVVDREVVHAALIGAGFERAFDPPCTGTRRFTEWHRGEAVVCLSTNVESGLAMFLLLGSETAPCEDLVSKLVRCVPATDEVARIARATNPADQAEGAFILRDLALNLRFDDGLDRALIASALGTLLASAEPIVRTAAVDAALELVWPELTDAVLPVVRTSPALAWIEEAWIGQLAKNAATDEARAKEAAKGERLADLERLTHAERWDEAASLAEVVFRDAGGKPEPAAWRARGLAAAGLGRGWEGAIFLAGWSVLDEAADAADVLTRAVARLDDDHEDLTSPLLALHAGAGDRTTAALEKLASLARAREAELDFVIAALEIETTYLRENQAGARPRARAAAKAFPDLAEAAVLLARAEAAAGDHAASIRAYRVALDLARQGRPPARREAALRAFRAGIAGDADDRKRVTASSVFRGMVSALQDPERFDELRAIVDEAVAAPDVDAEERADLLATRAMCATTAKRHDAAIGHYREAIEAERAAGKEPNGTLRFNLACELAKTGQAEPALAALGEAISLEESYATDAQTDDYFEALWDGSPFIQAVAAWTEPPTVEAVRRAIDQTLGRTYRGEGEEALQAAHVAVAGAETLGDPELLAEALEKFGVALTYHATPARGVRVLGRAVGLSKLPAKRAAIIHALGAAHHAGDDLDAAKARYDEALELRTQLGNDEAIAISLGDLARLALARGDADEAERLMVETIALLERSLAKTEGEDRWDALVNLALVQGNRVAAAADRAETAARVPELAEDAIARLTAIVDAGARIPAGTIERLRRALGRGMANASEESATRIIVVAQRLLELEEPDPRVRAERLYWAGLRAAAQELERQGVLGSDIARSISRAVRGQDPGEPIGSHPSFANLAVELSQRLTATTDIVMIAMALSLAECGQATIDKTLEDLREFAIANVRGVSSALEEALTES